MKGVLIRKPHEAEYTDLPQPSVGAGQVLVRVALVGICMSDVEVYDGTRPAPYVSYPCVPGHEWCGTVVEVGAGVRHLTVGDRVAVEGHNYCGRCFFCLRGQTNLCESYNELGFTLPGGYAEYVAVRADLAHPFSHSLPFESAVLTEPGSCAGHGMLRADVRPGDTVAVVGPGTIGLLGAVWARALQAGRIIAIGLDRKSEPLARRIGATDYLAVTEDPPERVRALTGGRGADVVVEAAGSPTALALACDVARRGGSVVAVGVAGGGRKLALDPDMFCLKDLRVEGIFAYTSEIFQRTLRRIEDGGLDVRPFITHRFPLERFREAFQLLRDRPEPVLKIVLEP
ncbi:MAG: alcohol dehydrogenase catalytic domain-containing protein [candidate division NC10 bacterium]|nr:alcohol dehydrogenase catalytic domain-containing protein [candidate division NC10 bacterium]MBI2116230.1 alcohol dehydrogenase catalytic domain-containing protein [candidate division NC10 bacterium]MBI2456346.1 alcohol dehydrogenase catalytic domain-containing protein [candidate division NC10 bacterium]